MSPIHWARQILVNMHGTHACAHNVFFAFLVRAECMRQRNEVAIKLGIISLSSSRRLLNLQERLIVGF